MNYIRLFNNSGGRRFCIREFGDIIVHAIVTKKQFAGMDFSEKPYSICMRNKSNNVVLYSLTIDKYRFSSRDSIREFIRALSDEDVEIMLKELTEINDKFNSELKIKIEKEAEMFDKVLQANDVDFVTFQKVKEIYNTLPRHIKQYYKVKNNLPRV